MLSALVSPEVQEYILENLQAEPATIALKKAVFENVSMADIASQIAARQRIKTKLPALYDRIGLLFPPKLNLEQSSSAETATYKAQPHSGKRLLDLTGGLGIDTMAFAQQFEEVHYCEHNTELAAIAAHNFKTLGLDNITVHVGDSLQVLESANWDMIYCDPDRRSKVQRAFRLEDCEPNVVALQERLLRHTDRLLIKAAPMLDLDQAQKQLPNLKQVTVLAVKGEVKELLLLCEAQATALTHTAVNLTTAGAELDKIRVINKPITYADPKTYLYLPHAALMKLQAFDYVGSQYKLDKLSVNSHIFTADDLVKFPGRRFRLLKQLPYAKKTMREYQKQDYLVISKNFPLPVAKLRQQYKIKDAGNNYLIFTTLLDGQRVVLEAEPIL